MRNPQLPLQWPYEHSTERDDLVVTPANAVAVQAIDLWPAWPHPVVMLIGPPGSGKSHLADVWRRASGASLFAERAWAIAPERPFTVLVEDLDRCSLDESEVFALVNGAMQGGGQVLLTARTAPSAGWLNLPDLASRLGAATQMVIGRPDDALLGGVLAKLFADRQIQLDPRHLPLLLSRMERSLDAARELVERVDRESLAAGRRVGRPMLLSVLDEIDGERHE